MSIFDNDSIHMDDIDKAVASKSLQDIVDFISGYMPEDIYYGSFTNDNVEEIKKYTTYKFNIPIPIISQNTYHVFVKASFYHIPCKNQKWNTYTQHSNIKCSRIELIRRRNKYYICPNYVKWPIIIDRCGLTELPESIRFSKKNPKSKTPLTFIVRNGGETCKWIYDLPKGSIVYILPSAYFTFYNYENDGNCFEFFQSDDFNLFVEEYGKKVIID